MRVFVPQLDGSNIRSGEHVLVTGVEPASAFLDDFRKG